MVSGLSVAVVVLNYNGLAHLQNFLPALLLHTPPGVQVVVADNASTDASVSWLSNHYPALYQIWLPKNNGYAGGYNEALKQVEADVFVLLNSDVQVSPQWIEPVVQWLSEDAGRAAAMPKIRQYTSPGCFEYAGACGGFLDGLGIPFCRGRVMDTVEPDDGQYNDAGNIFWASGAALFVKRAAFWQAGGFDETFFAHMEEIDLCWRLQLQQYSIGVVPSSVVYHVGGGTLPVGEKKLMLNLRNSLLMINRNTAGLEKWKLLALRTLLDWAFAAKEILNGRTTALKALLTAHRTFWKHRRKSANKFGKLQKKPLHALQGTTTRWIPTDYLIKRRKTFSQIMGRKTLM